MGSMNSIQCMLNTIIDLPPFTMINHTLVMDQPNSVISIPLFLYQTAVLRQKQENKQPGMSFTSSLEDQYYPELLKCG